MVARVAYIHPHLASAAALIAVFAAWGAERLGADSRGSPDVDGNRINVLHPNPQSIFDGLQVGFVNVSTGNLTFERRDIVVPGRRRVVFSRIHDSRIRGNADFGPGWRLSLDEEIVVDDDAASYVDGSGARYGFRRGPGGKFVPDPKVPRLAGTRLAVAGETATLDAGGDGIRLFQRTGAARDRWVLRRIEWPGGDWIEILRSHGRLATVFDGEGDMLRVERDAEGRIASVVDRHFREVRYEYDALGRLAEVLDLGGNPWSHEYDATNRLAAALRVDGAPYLRAGYDAAGRVAWSVGEAAFAFDYGTSRTVVSDRTTGGRGEVGVVRARVPEAPI